VSAAAGGPEAVVVEINDEDDDDVLGKMAFGSFYHVRPGCRSHVRLRLNGGSFSTVI
jgi:hypothetical protein